MGQSFKEVKVMSAKHRKGFNTKQEENEYQQEVRFAGVKRQMAPILDEANKQFDDALYRISNNDKRTAADLWVELKAAQNGPGDPFVNAIRCTSILNSLAKRGQIPENWLGK